MCRKKTIILGLALFLALAVLACQNKSPAQAIPEEEARKIALDKFDLDESSVTFTKVQKEMDDGSERYELEFKTEDEKFEVELGAQDGDILKYERENLAAGTTNSPEGDLISEQEAKKIALDKVPGADQSHLVKFKVDRDGGRIKYEGKIVFESKEYEFDIDALTGEVLDWDQEGL